MKKKSITYEARTLFDGRVIGKEGKYVAIPNKFKNNIIVVQFDNLRMTIENWHNADGYRKFDDKYGRRDKITGKTLQYTLGYFKWNPDSIQVQLL